VRGSSGDLATVVKGEVTRRFDADTGARPGRTVAPRPGLRLECEARPWQLRPRSED